MNAHVVFMDAAASAVLFGEFKLYSLEMVRKKVRMRGVRASNQRNLVGEQNLTHTEYAVRRHRRPLRAIGDAGLARR